MLINVRNLSDSRLRTMAKTKELPKDVRDKDCRPTQGYKTTAEQRAEKVMMRTVRISPVPPAVSAGTTVTLKSAGNTLRCEDWNPAVSPLQVKHMHRFEGCH